MKQELFREKSLERIQSPEDLNDYIRVSNPGVWLMLAAVIVLLIGAGIWGIFGRLDSTVKTQAYVEDGVAVCIVEEAQLEVGMKVTIADVEGEIAEVAAQEEASIAAIKTELPDGTYPAEITVGEVSPFSLIFR